MTNCTEAKMTLCFEGDGLDECLALRCSSSYKPDSNNEHTDYWTDIAYFGLDLINCVLIFLALILVYSFCRLLLLLALMGRYFFAATNLRLPLLRRPFQHHVSGQVLGYDHR